MVGDAPFAPNASLPTSAGRCSGSVADRNAEEESAQPAMDENKLRPETVAQLRALAHDLSNSLETIMQACYLLQQVKLEGDNRKWLELIDEAAQEATRINRQIREILRNLG